jgi:hypothetical protein
MSTPAVPSTLASIIPFPIQHSCPCCTRVCAPDDLTMCDRCGEQWCGRSGCPSTCACDRFVERIAEHMERMNPSLWHRAVSLLGVQQ